MNKRAGRAGRIPGIVLFWIAAALIAPLEAILTAAWLVGASAPRVYSNVDDVPVRKVGMLLGCPPVCYGRPNPSFGGRLQAAAKLYHAGKFQTLVVSGACRPEKNYDEIAAMTQDLIALGVPENAIVEDGKGLRTLDSILRMRDVFGYDDFITISQRYHCKRAIYLADHHGIATCGFEAEVLPGQFPKEAARETVRESLARVKAVLDIAVGRSAKYPTER